jgi:glycine oxidase
MPSGSSSSGRSIVVAGAGAIGRTAAYVLARAGHAVTVVDPDPEGGRASRVAAGMLAPAFESLFDPAGHYPLLHKALGLWPPLAEEIGLPIARQGAMALGTRREAELWAAQLIALGAGAQMRRLADDRWAAVCGEDCQLDALTALATLQSGGVRLDVSHVTGQVRAFDGGRVELADGATLEADTLVLATGADRSLTALAPELALLAPIKGHILRAPGSFIGAPVLRGAGVYLCRTPHGAFLGATMEEGRADTAVEDDLVRWLQASGLRLTRDVGSLEWTAAAGVRAATPDGLPMVGRGAAAGVVLAVGARRNGWLLAPMIAEVVLGAVEGRPVTPQSQLFDPARFSRG